MDMSRLRGGELIAAIGGIVLLVSLLFLNWYSIGVSASTPFGSFSVSGDFGAWDGQGFFGTIANLIMLAAGVVAVGLAVLTVTSRTVALPVAASAMTAGLGIAAVVMALGRMLFQPGPNDLVDLKFGIFLALVGAIAIAFGGWRSMQEEGTSFESARRQLQDRAPAGEGSGTATARPSTGAASDPAASDTAVREPEAPPDPSMPFSTPPPPPPPSDRR